MKKPNSWQKCAVGVAVVAVAVSACSSSKTKAGSTGTAASPASSAAPAPTGTPIKIMSIYQKSTGLAVDAALPDGAQAAVTAINKAGGVNGHPLSYTACDDQGSNTGARTCAQQATSGGYVAVVGSLTTEAGVYLPIFAQAHLAAIGGYANAAADFTSPASFPFVGGTGNEPAAVMVGLAKEGAKKISFAAIDTGESTLEAAAKSGLKAVGLTLNDNVSMPPTPPDMSPYVSASLANGTDGIEIFTDSADVISFVRQLRSQGSNVPVGIVTNNYPQVFQQLGSMGTGIVVQNDYYPGSMTSVSAVTKEAADFNAAGFGSALDDPYALNSYAAVEGFAKIAQNIGNLTAQSFFDAMSQQSNVSIGLNSPMQFTTGNKDGLGARIFNDCVFLTKQGAKDPEPIVNQWLDPQTGASCPNP